MRVSRPDAWLLIAALAGGTLFFATVHHLWPLAETDMNAPPAREIAQARAFLHARGIAERDHVAASSLRLDGDILDYLMRKFGMSKTQALIRAGEPIFVYEAELKQRGIPDSIFVVLHPDRGVVSWGRTVQEDAPGAIVSMDVARVIATEALDVSVPSPALRAPSPRAAGRGITSALASRSGERVAEGQVRGATTFRETGHLERDRPARRDHVFTYERYLSRTPELRERITVTVTGGVVSSIVRQLVLPESARREARAREAPIAAMQMASFILLGIAGLAAIAIFLASLRRGDVRLQRSAGLVAVVASFFVLTQALRSADLLARWDPLWPRWVANFQTLGFTLAQGAWIAAALFIVVAAGDALDRQGGANRGESFWLALRGRLLDRKVGVASARGFLVGLICGGALAAALMLLEQFAGAWVSIQPQGFFFFAINSMYPAVSTILYFFMVALVEELAYRFFAGTWLLSLTGKKWIAILVPGILYGASHTGLEFLPPSEPFWGRAVALTVVGCIWGWAFFRYDALTVVLSHFTADIFVFSWTRLGSGDPVLIAKAIATMLVPLAPAVLLVVRPRSTR